MPRKKVNWELEWFKIHNPAEQFYFKFGKTVLLSNNLFHTPTVTTNSVLSTKGYTFKGYSKGYGGIVCTSVMVNRPI